MAHRACNQCGSRLVFGRDGARCLEHGILEPGQQLRVVGSRSAIRMASKMAFADVLAQARPIPAGETEQAEEE